MKQTLWRFARSMVLAGLLLMGVMPAAAENLGPGGGSRVVVGDQMVGGYRMLVTVSPEPAQAGNTLTVTARLTDPSSNNHIRDATVQVLLVHTADGARLEGPATHENAGNLVDYTAHILVDRPGSWRATVAVDGPLGPARAEFDQKVLQPRQGSILVLAALPFLLALGALGIWYVRPRSRPAIPA
jgi:hypothetical protein